jgi:hypothetical protein
VRRERVGRDGDRAGCAVQDLHGVVALDDVLQAPAMARADDEELGVLGRGGMTGNSLAIARTSLHFTKSA